MATARQAIALLDIKDESGDTTLLVPQGARFTVTCDMYGDYTGDDGNWVFPVDPWEFSFADEAWYRQANIGDIA